MEKFVEVKMISCVSKKTGNKPQVLDGASVGICSMPDLDCMDEDENEAVENTTRKVLIQSDRPVLVVR